MPMKKALWAGVVNNQIEFFSKNPQGNVTGLQGMRRFHVTDQCTLVDDNGASILANTASGQGGTEDSGTIEQSEGNNSKFGDAVQTEPSQSQGGQATS